MTKMRRDGAKTAASYPQWQSDKGVDKVGISGNSFRTSSTSRAGEVLISAAAGLLHDVKL
jgi:hypothetical protein